MFDVSYDSVLWGLSPMMLVIGLGYHVISISTPYWLEGDGRHLGIFSQSLGNDTDVILDSISSWYKAAQAIEGLALVAVTLSVCFGLMRVNTEQIRWQLWCSVTSLLAGILTLIGSLVFGLGQPRPSSLWLSYAYVFYVFSGSLCLLASPALFVDVRWRRRERR